MKKNVFFILLGCTACIVCIFFVVRFSAPLTEKLKRLEMQCAELEETIEEQKRQIAELKDKYELIISFARRNSLYYYFSVLIIL